MSARSDHILLCGQDFAVWMVALALRAAVPAERKIIVVETPPLNPVEAHLYGHVLPPEVYKYHLDVGVTEPDFLRQTCAGFCWGTDYRNWGVEERSWVQAFHQPLPIWDGVTFPKIVAAFPSLSLQDGLISGIAARTGRFAHPPEDREHPLSRAEYGYLIDPEELLTVYRRLADKAGVERVQTTHLNVKRSGDNIQSVRLDDGTQLTAALFIDLSGASNRFRCNELTTTGSPCAVRLAHEPEGVLGPALRTITARKDGWTSVVNLRGKTLTLMVRSAPDADQDEARRDQDFVVTPAVNETPWRGNYIAMGLSSDLQIPMTLSAIKRLLRNIARLLTLIPISSDMHIEAHEYNRACADDRLHARLFDDAFFAGIRHPDTPFWKEITPAEIHHKLKRKLENFSRRGYQVSYDHEPYDDLDWAVLHDGLGRMPTEPDALTRGLDLEAQTQRIRQWRGNIAAVVQKMPPHALYMSKYLDYLERKQASNG